MLLSNLLTCSLTPDCIEASSDKTTRNETVVKQLRIISLEQSNRLASKIATCWQEAVTITTKQPRSTTYIMVTSTSNTRYRESVHSLILG